MSIVWVKESLVQILERFALISAGLAIGWPRWPNWHNPYRSFQASWGSDVTVI